MNRYTKAALALVGAVLLALTLALLQQHGIPGG